MEVEWSGLDRLFSAAIVTVCDRVAIPSRR